MKALTLTLALSVLITLASTKFTIDLTQSFILDHAGRYKIYHGVNVVVQLYPFIPNTDVFDPYMSFTDEDIAILKKLGINLVRLGVIWESVETAEEVYNYDHLEKLSDIVYKLEQQGIDVLLDAHQDMFTREFCGEGVPGFYAKKLDVERKCEANTLSKIFKLLTACIPLEKHNWSYGDDGMPLVDDCKTKGNFMDYHRSPELTSIYKSFYNNQNNIIDQFGKFWAVVAQKFKGRKNVIGYDIWNEPWPGNLWSDLKSLWPGHSDDEEVTPFYQIVDNAISKVDNDYILFYQPVPFPDTFPLFGGVIFPSFTAPPVDIDFRPQVFNVHNYCCQAGPDVCRSGEPSLEQAKGMCANFHEMKVKENIKHGKRLKAPIIVTEFGACSNSEACYYEMMGLIKAADRHLVSWAYWMYKTFGDHTTTAANNTEGIFNEDGTLQMYKEIALSRSYVQAYQGYPLSVEFNDETKELNASFKYDAFISEPSVVYIHKEMNYKNGYRVVVSDKDGKEVNAVVEEVDNGYIHVKMGSDVEDGCVVNIKVVAN